MALVNQDLVLDVVPGPIPPILHLTEYDENMEVVVTLMRRGQPFQIPTGTTVKIEGTLKGHPFSENGTPSGNTVTFMVSKNMTAYSGRAWTKIKLTKDSKPVSSCGFWLDNDRAGVEAETVIGAPGFEEQINQGVAAYFDGDPPFFELPSGGQSGQALLSDGSDGAYWGEVQGGGGTGGAVDSVNGKTGDVVLDASDVGALPSSYTPPVVSVNGETGAVIIPLAQPGETHINVLNPAEAEQGYIAAQGQINGSDTYWTTGYIPVSEGDVLRVFYDGTNKVHAYAAEYSTNAQSGFISRTNNGSYSSYTVQNDGYVRLSVKTSAVPWESVSSAMVTINDTDPTFIAYGDLGANDGLMSAADKKKLDGLGKSAGKKLFDKFLFIAYSSFGSRAPNSVPHFEYCAQRDYDWLKADVQPTSDGGLVCCHDSGFTLDSNGRITTYNSSSATEIYAMTLAQATALVYASYPTTHVASIDDFLEVCKKYGKVPYITIRDAHMDAVVPALMAALDKFALRSVAVINSSARASLDAVRAADKDITMSLFVNPFGSSMASGYNYALADGNTMLGYFYTQSSHTWAEFIADSTVAGYIANCIANGIVMWAGIESDASHVDDLIAMGFSGIHTMQDRPYPSELPTVTATDNGKFLRVVNGAWAAETVSTWQGGSY